MADGRGAPDDEVRAAIDATLAAGPTTLAELAGTLRGRGLLDHVGPDPDDEIDEVVRLIHRGEHIWIGPGGLAVLIEQLVRGTVMTHRLTVDDLARGMLDAEPDLELLDKGRIEPLDLDGAPVERVFPDEFEAAGVDGSYMGPSGWLDGFAPGDVIGFRREGAQITIERLEQVGTGADEADALRQAFNGRGLEPGIGELIEAVVLDAIVDTPGLFREPVRPIGELLADAGLSCQAEWTGPADIEWVPDYVAAARDELELIIERYQLDDCCIEALYAAMDMWNDFVLRGERDWSWSEVGDALAHGWVAAAFTDNVLADDTTPNDLLAAFAGALAEAPRKHDQAVGAFVTARNLERGGDALEAEAALETAVRLDPLYEPAVEDLAWFAADRSDAAKAVNMLRRAGAEPDDPQLLLLEAMRPVSNAVGRNERCPCGSGRKYKDCCQRRTIRPLDDRARWLEHKLWTFTLRPYRQPMPLVLAALLSSGDDEQLDDILASGLPMDLAAFESGLAEAFLRERGALLPQDERELLETWLRHPRELWEVVERAGESTVVVRSAASGVIVSVPGFGDDTESGDLFLARIAPLGSISRVVGVPVRLMPEQRTSADALVASQPNAWQIVQWLVASTGDRVNQG